MNQFIVSQDTEIILDGRRVLLESGDTVMIEDVRGDKYNEVKQATNFDVDGFVKDNIKILMQNNPSLRVGDVLDSFVAKFPHYLTEGDMAEQMSPEEIMKKLYNSVRISLTDMGLHPNPIGPGNSKKMKPRPIAIKSNDKLGKKKRLSPPTA